jgi:hypothetical protein
MTAEMAVLRALLIGYAVETDFVSFACQFIVHAQPPQPRESLGRLSYERGGVANSLTGELAEPSWNQLALPMG